MARPTSTAKRPVTPEDIQRFTLLADPVINQAGDCILFTRKHITAKNDYGTNLWRVAIGDPGAQPVPFSNGGKDSHGRFSPDGASVAFLRAPKGQSAQIYLMPVNGGEAQRLTNFPEGTIGSFKFSPDGSCLAVAFRPTHPDWTLAAKQARETEGRSTPAHIIDNLWYRLDGDGYFGPQRFGLYLVSIETGEHELIFAKDALGDFGYDFSPNGEAIAISANTDRRALQKPWMDQIYLFNIRRRTLKPIPNLPEGPKNAIQFSPDGKWIAYAGRQDRHDGLYSTENLRLYICDPGTGRTRDLIGHTDYCMMAVTLSDTAEAKFGPLFQWHPDSRHLIARIGWHGTGHLALVPIQPRNQQITMLTKGQYEYSISAPGCISQDGTRLAFLRSDATTLPEIGIGEIQLSKRNKPTTASVRMVTSFNRALLKELAIAKPTVHWVESTDGVKVQTWVMYPPTHRQNSRKKYPAVLEIHGGPHGQYGVPFFHEFQVLASAGHIVVYSNPRGSKGYGRDFCHAIRGAWGTKDWEDIQAVTAFMRNHPSIDAKRMGVMGGSYGGYMTNWVIGHTREFAGAITDRCVSNLISMGGNSDYPDTPDRYWEGDFYSRIDARWKSSPIRHLGSARTPTLIIHSEGDLRCNIEQAEQVFTVLQLNGVRSRFVRYPASTSHGMSRMGPPDLRQHRLHQILSWWESCLH